MKEAFDKNILYELKAYKKIFDSVQVIDPFNKKVIHCYNNELVTDEISCYSLLPSNDECANCICFEALKKKRTTVKILHIAEKLLLIFALPVETNDKKVVIQLIKDISNGLVFETVYQFHEQEHELQNITEDFKNLIMKDTLTSLFNRRYIEKTLHEEINKCSDKQPLSVAMVDIDFFKKVNDTYGHDIGDLAIKKISKIIIKSIRNDTDWAARYGGEEFLICLPNTSDKKAYKVLERIRKTIEKERIKVNNEIIKITASFGLYTTIERSITPSNLIKFADEKLYQAKSEGRNRVVM